MVGRSSSSLEAETADATDAELIDLVRNGCVDAYGVLYERHCEAAKRFARSLVIGDLNAEDVVAEVFVSVLAALERGRGPVDTFAPYLFASIRNECQRVGRRHQRECTDRFDDVDGDGGVLAVLDDPYRRVDDAEVMRVAFGSLPANFRDVLWHTEVFDSTPTELADRSGATAHSLAMRAMRARRALGDAYLHQHLSIDEELDVECREVRPQLAGYVRGSSGRRRRHRIDSHLDRCAGCSAARDGLGRVNRNLRAVPLLPLSMGSCWTWMVNLKDHVVTWSSGIAVPVATSGLIAVSALTPISPEPAPMPTSSESQHRQGPPDNVAIAPPDDEGLFSSADETPIPGPSGTSTTWAAAGLGAPTLTPLLVPEVGIPGTPHPPPPAAAAMTDDIAAEQRTGASPGPTGGGNPDNTDTPPGQAVAANPGNTGTPPGQAVAANPGNTGTPPGQTIAANPNATGTPPGHAVAADPGNPGTPPGQTEGGNPGNGGTPPGHTVAANTGNPGTPPGHTVAANTGNPGSPPGQGVTSEP